MRVTFVRFANRSMCLTRCLPGSSWRPSQHERVIGLLSRKAHQHCTTKKAESQEPHTSQRQARKTRRKRPMEPFASLAHPTVYLGKHGGMYVFPALFLPSLSNIDKGSDALCTMSRSRSKEQRDCLRLLARVRRKCPLARVAGRASAREPQRAGPGVSLRLAR